MLTIIVIPGTESIDITSKKSIQKISTFTESEKINDDSNNLDMTNLFLKNIIVYKADYKSNFELDWTYLYSSGNKNYKMEMKLAIHNIVIPGFPQHYVMAKTKSYVKKHVWLVSWWAPYQTNVQAGVGGVVEAYMGNKNWTTVNCSRLESGFKSEIDAKVQFGTDIRVQRYWISGYFSCNGYSFYKSLTW